jgi:uncharacterized phosphosugar-binding protein
MAPAEITPPRGALVAWLSIHLPGEAERGESAVTNAAGRWLAQARDVLDRIEQTQMGAIATTAARCADTIAAGGLVHLFGSGHSRIPVEEMFPRYGSYPGFHPMAELSMTFHTQIAGSNGQRQAMFIERVEGLGEVILANFQLEPTDVMIVFSASGTSAVPIEIAMGAQARGLHVIAVTALAHSKATTPLHSSGTRLFDHADVVIDLCTPVGDAAVALEGAEDPVGPMSTLASVAVVNEIKVQTAQRLAERGELPPILTSAALAGEARSTELFDLAYRDHARRLARALTGSG